MGEYLIPPARQDILATVSEDFVKRRAVTDVRMESALLDSPVVKFALRSLRVIVVNTFM